MGRRAEKYCFPDMGGAYINFQKLWLPAKDLNKIKPVKIPA